MTTDEQTSTTDDLGDVIHQPTLPTMELPEYHGRKPVGMKTALAGAGTRVTRPHTIGDRIVLVIEARVKKASHEDTDDGLVYAESLKVLDLFELDPDQGARLISTVRSLYRTAEDAVKGRRPIPDLGDTGYTDGSGVVLTPAEVADLRGDPIRAILSPELTPAVIVYDDGARDLWPDDYPKDAPRPKVGEKYLTEGGDAIVTQLLHHETGEELAALADVPTEAEIIRQAAIEAANAEEAGNPEEQAAIIADAVAELVPDPETEPTRRAPLAAVPDLPPAPDDAPELDPYAGDLGDDASGWEPETPPRPMTAEEAETARIEALLPTAADFELVDCQIPELVKRLDNVTDLAHANRLMLAEKHGRGRGLQPRAGAQKWLGAKIEALTEAGQVTP